MSSPFSPRDAALMLRNFGSMVVPNLDDLREEQERADALRRNVGPRVKSEKAPKRTGAEAEAFPPLPRASEGATAVDVDGDDLFAADLAAAGLNRSSERRSEAVAAPGGNLRESVRDSRGFEGVSGVAVTPESRVNRSGGPRGGDSGVTPTSLLFSTALSDAMSWARVTIEGAQQGGQRSSAPLGREVRDAISHGESRLNLEDSAIPPINGDRDKQRGKVVAGQGSEQQMSLLREELARGTSAPRSWGEYFRRLSDACHRTDYPDEGDMCEGILWTLAPIPRILLDQNAPRRRLIVQILLVLFGILLLSYFAGWWTTDATA